MTLLLSPRLVERENLPGGEYYALTLFALAGMMLMRWRPTCSSSSSRWK